VRQAVQQEGVRRTTPQAQASWLSSVSLRLWSVVCQKVSQASAGKRWEGRRRTVQSLTECLRYSDLLLRHRRGCDGVAKTVKAPTVKTEPTDSVALAPARREAPSYQLPTPASHSPPNAYASSSSSSTSLNAPRSPKFPDLAPPTPGSSSSSGRASPPTPFESGTLSTYIDPYIDPTLSRDFTQDEILASEVLEVSVGSELFETSRLT
jgi:hypothetical protein